MQSIITQNTFLILNHRETVTTVCDIIGLQLISSSIDLPIILSVNRLVYKTLSWVLGNGDFFQLMEKIIDRLIDNENYR